MAGFAAAWVVMLVVLGIVLAVCWIILPFDHRHQASAESDPRGATPHQRAAFGLGRAQGRAARLSKAMSQVSCSAPGLTGIRA
jgi:hypothetical protein